MFLSAFYSIKLWYNLKFIMSNDNKIKAVSAVRVLFLHVGACVLLKFIDPASFGRCCFGVIVLPEKACLLTMAY